MEYPVAWRVLNKQKLVSIQEWMDETIKNEEKFPRAILEKSPGLIVEGKLILNAYAPSKVGFAAVRIDRFPPDPKITPAVLAAWTEKDARAFEERFQKAMTTRLETQGQRFIRWDGARVIQFDGKPSVSIQYVRSGKEGDVEVEQIHVSERNAYWITSFAWRKSEERHWKPFVSRMRNSLRFQKLG